jgi:hypothetical protein
MVDDVIGAPVLPDEHAQVRSAETSIAHDALVGGYDLSRPKQNSALSPANRSGFTVQSVIGPKDSGVSYGRQNDGFIGGDADYVGLSRQVDESFAQCARGDEDNAND